MEIKQSWDMLFTIVTVVVGSMTLFMGVLPFVILLIQLIFVVVGLIRLLYTGVKHYAKL